MKLKLILGLGLLASAGLVAAFAAAPSSSADPGTTTDSTTSTTTSTTPTGPGKGKHGDKPPKDKSAKPNACRHVNLKGSDGSGSVTFTVTKAGRQSSALVGQVVTLTIPAGSALRANVCVDAAGALTLHDLKVDKPKPPAPLHP